MGLLPEMGCDPSQLLSAWLLRAAVCVVVLIIETMLLSLVSSRRLRRFAMAGVLGLVTLTALAATIWLGLQVINIEASVGSSFLLCDHNGMLQTTLGQVNAVLDIFNHLGLVIGSIVGLSIIGTLITTVSLIFGERKAAQESPTA